jgi:pimeloyl-ACP methyl ester carboxylesterase
MKELFLLSGLGADKRVFGLLDFRQYKVHHVGWVTPLRAESLTDYTARILPQITSKKPILIGVSFGGVVAQKIGKLIDVEKIILISSAKFSSAIPSYIKFFAKLNVQKWVPPRLLKKPNSVLFWLFGVELADHRRLLTSIMADTDDIFFSWAVETISKWENGASLSQIVQIHGTNDKILKLHTADYVVEGGGHLMVVTHSSQVSKIINEIILS